MKKNALNISEKAINGRNGVQLVYVLNCIKNSSMATDEGLTFDSDADALKFFFDTFDDEFNDRYNKRRYPNLQARIGEYLQGLPSCMAVDYWNEDIIRLGLSWGVLDQPDGRKAEKFINDWFNTLALRILQAANKVGLNPYQYAI